MRGALDAQKRREYTRKRDRLSMDIRPLTEVDAEAYWAVRLRALREESQAFGSSYEEQQNRPLALVAERLRAMTASDDFILGAFEGTGDMNLVGIMAFGREQGRKNRHVGMVYQVYVAPEVRGRGYSRALLEALIARARTLEGMERLNLGVVVGNPAARGLYTALGFEVYGRQPEALKFDDGTYRDEELMSLRL